MHMELVLYFAISSAILFCLYGIYRCGREAAKNDVLELRDEASNKSKRIENEIKVLSSDELRKRAGKWVQ